MTYKEREESIKSRELPHLSKYLVKISPEAHKFRNRLIKHNICVK